MFSVALRKESVDRNTRMVFRGTFMALSLSARRAWIEIKTMLPSWTRYAVALRKESVDRNIFLRRCTKWMQTVALRKESVDRNHAVCADHHKRRLSLSARRAWIEIL